MQQWEYMSRDGVKEKDMNAIGAQGWELCTALKQGSEFGFMAGSTTIFIFKRPVAAISQPQT